MEKSRITFASFEMKYRGREVFESGKVKSVEDIGDNKYKAYVMGSNNKTYEVILDNLHLIKSTCTCPYCDGHQRRFCKHKVAALFKAFPNEYQAYLAELEENERLYHEALNEYNTRLSNIRKEAKALAVKKLDKMSSEKIKEELLKRLIDEEAEYLEEELNREYGFNNRYY